MPETQSGSHSKPSPDYVGLVRFLLKPFLDSPAALKVDCEMSHAQERVWIRIAFEGTDKGRVFGRGGRNIQAIRTATQAVARAAGQSIHLDIYDGSGGTSRRESAPSRNRTRRGSSPPKSAPKTRS